MHVNPVALIALAALSTCTPDTGPAELTGSVVEAYDLAFFGGLSGLDFGADEGEVTLLLDSGLLIRGQLQRDAAGAPTGLRRWRLVPIEDRRDGMFGQRGMDAEGVAVDGADIYVSLERVHAVWRLSGFGEVVERLPPPPGTDELGSNASFEALAVAGGALYTLPERSATRGTPFPVWRFADGAWEPAFSLPRRGRFLAVGADFGPDECFYLLERRFLPPAWFATRVRRFATFGGEVVAEETVLETALGTHDNLEGIAVWGDAAGDIRLTMVSDDNFSRWQETQIVDYRVPPALACHGQDG
jgi:hypothetical protein